MSQTADKYISGAALDALLSAHDGDVALLYLYALRHGDAYSSEQAARDLCRTLGEIENAREKLSRLSLPAPAVQSAPAKPEQTFLPPAEELPQYPSEQIARFGREDAGFSAILAEAGQVMGRHLNTNEMRTLLGIYDHLALPAEVVVLLLHFVADNYRERYGESRRPSARAIEKEAYHWANQEILTLEQADAYIQSQRRRRGDLSRLQVSLGIYGRDLGATERKYLSSWLDLGFGDKAIGEAYDRTVSKTGGLKWAYMNKILLSWHEKGLHTLQEIEAGDPRRKSGTGAKPALADADPFDPHELDEILQRQK